MIERCSLRPDEQLEQRWRRIVFSILISNTDDHLRNHGFLHASGDNWRLAPAFDINPNPEPGTRYLSTAVDDSDTTASSILALQVAEYFRLDRARARQILAEIVHAVREWPRVAARHGRSPREISEMREAFSPAEELSV